MANNVYIGNRYVPVFADPVEWDSLRTYEALTIVTYLGTSYTSRKAVPAGIQLSNTEYWVVTGNYNAQVAQLTNDVSALSSDFSDLSNDFSDLSNDVSALSGNVSALSGNVSELSNDVDNIPSDPTINNWTNVVKLGAKNDGTADISTVVMNFLNGGGYALYFPAGTYLLNNPLNINKSFEFHLDVKAKIIVTSEIDTLINVQANYELDGYSDVFGYKRCIIDGGIIDCGGHVNTVIKLGYVLHSRISNIKIKDFKTCGIRVDHGAGNLVDNAYLWGKSGNATYGYYGTIDGTVSNTTTVNCFTGFSSAFDVYYHCSSWIDEHGTVAGSTAFENRSHSSYTECVADTVQYGWKALDNATTEVCNCYSINNAGVVTPDTSFYMFYSVTYSKWNIVNFFTLLPSYTFTNERDSNVHILNADGTGNLPLNLDLGKSGLKTRRLDNNVTAQNIDNLTDNSVCLAYIEPNTCGNTNGGWGTISIIKPSGSSFCQQIVIFADASVKSRFYDGTSWSAWS